MAGETLFLSSSLALLITSCAALILALFFRSKYHKLNRLAKNPSVNVFSRTFNVFDPYPARRKIIESFFTVLPLLVFACTGLALLIFVEIVAAGLLLSLIIMIISVNLLVVDGVFEVYQNARVFITACQRGVGFGEGDLTVLQVLKKSLHRISSYYFGLAAIFAIFDLTLPYSLPCLEWVFAQLMDLIFRGGVATGFTAYSILMLWVLSVTVVTIFIRKVKSELLKAIFAHGL